MVEVPRQREYFGAQMLPQYCLPQHGSAPASVPLPIESSLPDREGDLAWFDPICAGDSLLVLSALAGEVHGDLRSQHVVRSGWEYERPPWCDTTKRIRVRGSCL